MRIKRFGRASAVGLALLLVSASAVWAADLATDVQLSTTVAAPTEVSIGPNPFTINVTATGNVSSGQSGQFTVTTVYNMATNGTITAGATTQSFDLTPAGGAYNFSQCATEDPANALGCASNPIVVNATLNVAAGTPDGTTGSFSISHTGTPGTTADTTLQTLRVVVEAGDSTAPTVTIVKVTGTGTTLEDTTAPFEVYTNNGSAITWKADEAGNYAVYVDAACGSASPAASGAYATANAEVTTSLTNTDLGADGVKTVRVCVTDAATNTGSATASVHKDTASPTVSVTGFADGATFFVGATLPTVGCSRSDETGGSGLDATGSTGPTQTAFLNGAGIGTATFTCGARDNAGNSATATSSYSVGYGVCVLYDQLKAHQAGSTVPIRIQLCDADGNNLSSADVIVKATTLKKQDNSASGVVEDSGYANPDDNFRFAGDAYIFNLSTKSPNPALGAGKTKLGTGTWVLKFTVDGVSFLGYCVTFGVK